MAETRTAGADGQHTYTVGECGKRTYGKPGDAKRLARRLNLGGRARVAPYHCTRCHGWHLGNHRRKQDQRRSVKEKACIE